MIERVVNYRHASQYNDNNPCRIFAKDQEWDQATLAELKSKYHIFFKTNKDAVNPILVIDNSFFIGHEDDGQIIFEREDGKFKNGAHVGWISSLIDDLKAAENYGIKQLKKTRNANE